MSGNPKFTTEDAVRIIRHINVTSLLKRTYKYEAINPETRLLEERLGVRWTMNEAYEIASQVMEQVNPTSCGREPGTYVTDSGEVRKIRAPRPETQPVKRLHPVSIASLIEAEVDDTETHDDDIRELGLPAKGPVAGEDTEIEAALLAIGGNDGDDE